MDPAESQRTRGRVRRGRGGGLRTRSLVPPRGEGRWCFSPGG